jgi:hypothetical protein
VVQHVGRKHLDGEHEATLPSDPPVVTAIEGYDREQGTEGRQTGPWRRDRGQE